MERTSKKSQSGKKKKPANNGEDYHLLLKMGENSNNNSATLPFQSSFIPTPIKPQPAGPAQGAGPCCLPATNFHIKHVVIKHVRYMNIFLDSSAYCCARIKPWSGVGRMAGFLPQALELWVESNHSVGSIINTE